MRAKYLRDARHLDKTIYTMHDKLFYEPFEAHYRPSDEYTAIVKDLLQEYAPGWIARHDGFWTYVRPGGEFAMPAQGWKVHVSGTIWNDTAILKKAARIALMCGVPFKFAPDRKILSMMSSKRWQRGGSGKFITMYPMDISCFKSLLEQLYKELCGEEGPYILSDKRYKDCRVLYYRFGGMARTSRMDITGEKALVITSPEGDDIPDIRTPYFTIPPWEKDPFPSDELSSQDLTLNKGKYLIKRAFAFSNSGGVYLAEDRSTGQEIVIKEARAHTVVDDRGNDAIKRLKKEYEILDLFRNSGFTPKPVDAFQEWENFFLVEEFIDGVDIREFMLGQSPLLRVRPSLDDSRRFYEIFTKVVKNLVQAVAVLHEQGIVFGDLSPNNIKINPSTHAVQLIDFEVAFRRDVDKPTYLYTPGFRSSRKNTLGFEDDLYSIGAIMLYMLFPIAAIASLRDDLYDTVLKIVLADVGWSETQVFNVINGCIKNETTLNSACALLDKPARIQTPKYKDDIDTDWCEKTYRELGDFVLANMRPDRNDGLFPADPFVHRTNPLSLGFGACGVLYVLKKCGFEISRHAYDWLDQRLDKTKPEDLPSGLLTGAAGIAWCLGELGLEDRAEEFMKMAHQNVTLKRHHSYLYGMAGVGMANLALYIRTKKSIYLTNAGDLADSLLQSARESAAGIYWETDNLVHLGYGYGQSGVALFLLRMFQLSGKEKYLLEGKRALEFDLSHGIEPENGVLSFPRGPADGTIEPYLEDGSAGIAKVAIRYGMWGQMEKILSDVYRKYAVFPGLLYGLGSFVDILTDASCLSGDIKFLGMAKRPIAGIRDMYLLKQANGAATPGDGLFRLSCDYATGSAGVLRALYRFVHLEKADFVLDEVDPLAAGRLELIVAAAEGHAISS